MSSNPNQVTAPKFFGMLLVYLEGDILLLLDALSTILRMYLNVVALRLDVPVDVFLIILRRFRLFKNLKWFLNKFFILIILRLKNYSEQNTSVVPAENYQVIIDWLARCKC